MTAEPATFEFGAGRSFRVKLEPVRISQREGQLRVGARFQNLPVAGMRVLSEFLIREFLDETRALDRLLLDPRTLTSNSETFIRRHLRRCLIWERKPLRVYDQGNLLPFTILAERMVEVSGRQLIQAHSRQAGLVEGVEYTFVVSLPGSVSHFTSRVEYRSGDTLFIPLPSELHQAGFRDSIRTQVTSDGQATVRCTHPRLAEEIIVRPLLDLSAKGFAFESDPERDLLFPGDRLSFIEIRFADQTFEGSGIIRKVSPHRGSDQYSCGIEILEFAEPGQERLWRERVFRHVHPRAVVAEPPVAARKSWQVLGESGYLRLWAPGGDIEGLEEAYSRTWSEPRSGAGRLMLVESRGQTVGTLAGSLLYPKTWLVHQLGVTERERAGLTTFLGLAYELYSGLMYLFQQEAMAEYFVIFAERDRRWTETLYGRFAAQCPDRAAFAYTANRVFRRDPAVPISRVVIHPKTVDILPATRPDLELVARALELSCSALECDSMAYAASEIGLEAFGERCRAFGWERSRQVYVAHDHGVPVAALIAENGGEGVNIFGLMNCCSIVNLSVEPLPEAVKAALLEEAAQHFLRLEKPVFIFFDEADADVRAVELMGFEFVSDGMRFIASKQIVPAWLSYLENALTLRNAAEDRRSG
jgi:hypothetical protein